MCLHLYTTIPSRPFFGTGTPVPKRHLPPGRSRDGAAGVSALAGRLHHHVAGQVLGQVLLHLGKRAVKICFSPQGRAPKKWGLRVSASI